MMTKIKLLLVLSLAMIKKLMLFLALLPLFASAQITPAQDTTLIAGSTPYTPQKRFVNVTLSGVNYRITQSYNSLIGKYDSDVTTKYLRAFYAPLSAIPSYTAGYGLLLSSNQFRVDTANIVTKIWANRYLTKATADGLYAGLFTYAANAIYRGDGTATQVPSNITDDGQFIVLDAKPGGQVELNHNGQQKVVVDDNTTYVFNDLNITGLNAGNTTDDFVVSNGGLIKKRAASTVANPADSKYKNILTYGGNPNGIADNTAAFYAAKGAGNTIIYFPQNAAGNAKYYFAGPDPLYIFGLTIDSDPGVIIDAPYYQSGGGQFFSSNVTLLLRGIQDTLRYYPNTPGPKQLHINDADYDKSKVSPLLNTQVVTGAFNWGGNTGPAFEGSLVDTSRVQLNSGVATGTLNYVGYNIGIGDELNGNFTAASSSTNSGAFVRFTDNSWIYFNNGGSGGGGTYAYHYKPLGGTFVETTVSKNIGFANDLYTSYSITKSLITIRKISNTTFAIMINGKEFFERFDYGKEIDLVGFANYNTAATSIVENITTTINKVSKGRTNVVVDIYGDSKSEKSIASWDRYFQETVNNTNGVRIQKVNNYAISGNDIKNQYNLFHAKGVVGVDAVIVSLGTNDIQNGSSPDTCLKYLNKFHTEVIGQGKKLLVVNPTLWYSYALAGNTGQNTTNFDNGSTTRGAITFWAANHPLVKYVDIMPTTPEAIFNKGLLIDNIHPQDELNRINGVDIAKAFMSAWETQNEPIEPKFSQYATISRKGATIDSLNFLGKIVSPIGKFGGANGMTIRDFTGGGYGSIYHNSVTPGSTNYSFSFRPIDMYLNATTVIGSQINNTNITEVRSTGLTVNGGINATGTITGTDASLLSSSISGAKSASSWTTSGLQFKTAASTLTNTSTAASGTVTTQVGSSLGRPTFASTNTGVTVTNGVTHYIAGEPIAGTNTTITNPFAVWVDRGNTNLRGTSLSVGSGNAQGANIQTSYDNIKFGSGASIYSNNNGANTMYAAVNYYPKVGGGDTYTTTGTAAGISLTGSAFSLWFAPSGTANTPASLTSPFSVSNLGYVTASAPAFSSGTPLLLVRNGTSGFFETVTTLPSGTNAITPTAAGNVVNKAYADGLISGAIANTLSKTASYAIVAGDFVADKAPILDLYVDATAGAVAITLPSAATFAGYTIYITKTDVSANAVTVSTVAGLGILAAQYNSGTYMSSGSAWYNH